MYPFALHIRGMMMPAACLKSRARGMPSAQDSFCSCYYAAGFSIISVTCLTTYHPTTGSPPAGEIKTPTTQSERVAAGPSVIVCYIYHQPCYTKLVVTRCWRQPATVGHFSSSQYRTYRPLHVARAPATAAASLLLPVIHFGPSDPFARSAHRFSVAQGSTAKPKSKSKAEVGGGLGGLSVAEGRGGTRLTRTAPLGCSWRKQSSC